MLLAAKIFDLAGPSAAAVIIMLVVFVAFTGLALLFLRLGLASRSISYEVDGDGLHVRAPLFSRDLARSQLALDQARVVDLAAAPELKPRRRTKGLGLPGFRLGWFYLHNGERALVFLTRPSQVVYLPTHEGYPLLLATPSGEELLAALR